MLSLWMLFLLGCNKPAQIERYTVEKLPNDGLPADTAPALPANHPPTTPSAPLSPAATTDRMLGAMVVDGDMGWFFKATGPKDSLEKQTEAFTAFIKSIKFVGGKPEWTLPEGWSAIPGSGMRFATLQLDKGDKPLELSVIALPKSGVGDDEYVLMNINRWRGQLKLDNTTTEKLAAEATTIPTADNHQATFVNLVGTAAPSNMGGGPFSGGQR
jgi:hypothetical protein